MRNRVVRRRAQRFEVGRPSIGIFLLEPLLVGDRLLLHIFDIERPAPAVVQIELVFASLATAIARQALRQLDAVVNPAVQSQATDRIVDVGRVAGEQDAA